MTTRTALLRGLASIRAHGWIQGRLGNRSEGYCAIGALPPVDPEGGRHRGAKMALQRCLTGPDLAAWNDAPGREQPEVEALYALALASS